MDLLFHLLVCSLVASYMCPDQGLNPHPWCIGTMLQPTELPGQGIMLEPQGLKHCQHIVGFQYEKGNGKEREGGLKC